MHSHRVLPHPLALADNPPGPGPPGVGQWYNSLLNPKPDALLQHKIMTTYESKKSLLPTSHRFRPPPSPPSPPLPAPLPPTTTATTTTTTTTQPGQAVNGDDSDDAALSPDSNDQKETSTSGKRKREASIAESNTIVTQSNSIISGVAERLPSIKENSLSSSKPADLPSQICLCQPDPKVPRPRNAFILFRQHHQAKVVAENPGLANPEISKIIGEEWRQSPDEVKQHWKQLAEEEKARHQKQYPDYRYQPKRGRNSVPATTPSGQGSPRCLKCGGKSMASPPSALSPRFRNPAPAAHAMDGPPSPYHSANLHHRAPYGVPGAYSLTTSTPIGYASRQAYTPHPPPRSPGVESPEAKRRRYEVNGRYPSRSNGPMSTVPLTPIERGLPLPEYAKASSGMPVPLVGRSQHVHSVSRSEGLTLAPLKIKRASLDSLQGQARGVEAMIMSIKPLSKIKTLAKISAPLQKPGPASPPRPIRGAVIAVEGSDFAAMEAIGRQIREDLERNDEHKVRSWDIPHLDSFDDGGRPSLYDILQLMTHWHAISREIVKYITRMPEDGSSGSSTPVSPSSKHKELRRDHRNLDGDSEDDEDEDERHRNENNEQRYGGKQQRPHFDKQQRTSNGHIGDDRSKAPLGPVPIALVPNYQLTTTDLCSSIVPIGDQYSPVDHWQWVAALWRGTVGPDVIICVRGPDDADVEASPKTGIMQQQDRYPHLHQGQSQHLLQQQAQMQAHRDWHARHSRTPSLAAPSPLGGHHLNGHGLHGTEQQPGGAVKSGGAGQNGVGLGIMSPSPAGNKQARSGVDVRLEEARTVVVRCERRGEVSEQILRRVAFEVGEWLRGREDRERGERDGATAAWGR